MVWDPTVGMELSGKLNLCSPDHISLLVHRTFNWHFEYGPAENDPEFWNGTYGEDPDPDADTMMDENNVNGEEDTDKSMGKWFRTDTGEKIGGPSGVVSFTVVGTTVANQMLSLVGSLQPDPFSPAHVPHQIPQTKKSLATSPSPSRFPSPSHPLQTAIEDGDDDDDDDLLAALSPSKDKSNLAQNTQGKKSSGPGQGPHQEQSQASAANGEENLDVEAEKARKAERKRKRREEKALAKEQVGEGEQLPGKKKKMKMKGESP
ncbi:hypothetical protein BS47DRAFT_1337470 [Hydnum rufescens UP504]|uniref:RPA43 OB domain-containing protein n=1 Tax=Hydnum rufescens UP504 TaxID=1448309 RepID=A0A9P6B820_9AGAM|nr:hypothetical protein BS47DRAFT_1337470 [Hydnum rufescens UP504]